MGSLFGSIPDRAAPLKQGQIWDLAGNAINLPWAAPDSATTPPASAGAPMDIQPRAVLAAGAPPRATMSEIAPPAPPPGAAAKTLAGRAMLQSSSPPSTGGVQLPLTGASAQSGSWRDAFKASGANPANGLPAVGGESAFDFDPASDQALDFRRGRDDAYNSWYSARIDHLPDPEPQMSDQNWLRHERFNELPGSWSAAQRRKALIWLSRSERGGGGDDFIVGRSMGGGTFDDAMSALERGGAKRR